MKSVYVFKSISVLNVLMSLFFVCQCWANHMCLHMWFAQHWHRSDQKNFYPLSLCSLSRIMYHSRMTCCHSQNKMICLCVQMHWCSFYLVSQLLPIQTIFPSVAILEGCLWRIQISLVSLAPCRCAVHV